MSKLVLLCELEEVTSVVIFKQLQINLFYYINTSEIQGERSRVNMISSHVKITCYFILTEIFG